MSERLELVTLALVKGANLSLLARRFGVSRQTADKWVRRYRAGGEEGLIERSRRPLQMPMKASDELEAAVVGLRRKHPTWGGRKLAARLKATGAADIPAPSTITQILRRHGLLDPVESQVRKALVRFEHEKPNDLWQMDFKGHVPMSSGRRCHPLTVLDDHSRYSILLVACGDEKDLTVRGHLTAAFVRYGLPQRMLMDNGAPWGSGGWSDISPWTRLTVWLARLGVAVTHGKPKHPQTQGKEERFHRTLKADLLQWHTFSDLADAQAKLDPWRLTYNHERPHEAIGMGVPASRYTPSPRPFPSVLPPVEYGTDDLVRKVSSNGKVSIHGRTVMIGSALDGQRVALRATRVDGLFDVFYCQVRLGRVDLRADAPADARLGRPVPLEPLADDQIGE